jgi:hypothetical protein
MELTREKALELHYQMWGDMQNDLGDNPEPELRSIYKEKWINEHFPGEIVTFNCFLCAYAGRMNCWNCPINWDSLTVEGKGYCFEPYKGGGTEDCIYLDAPISEILALPEREV